MAGVRQRPTQGGKYQGWYFDYTGTRVFFTAPTRTEARRIGEKLEAEHRQVRLGYRPLSESRDEHKERPFEEAKNEYLSWGQAQGGRGGRPWGETHARNRRAHLAWWQEHLNLKTLADLSGVLPRVEEALRKLRNQKRAGKTLNNYAEALGAFCVWCVQRNYLADDPLKALVFFDDTPRTERRAMTTEEVVRLLDSCPSHHRLLLETAFLSGLRANELRNLTVNHLDLEGSKLWLDGAWTKNRKEGVQPIPRVLTERLKVFGDSGEASQLYDKYHSRKGARRKVPERPLLYVPSHPARTLDEILKVAKIPKHTPEGKLDFHACRLAFINFVIESGVTVKEAQTLARHSTPGLTMNTYGRTRGERLAETVEKIGGDLLAKEKCVPGVYRLAAAQN